MMNKNYMIIGSIFTIVIVVVIIFVLIWKNSNSESFNEYPEYKKILDQMNKTFSESQPTDLSLNGKNYNNLPNIKPQPSTKFKPPEGGSDIVLKGKDGKEYLMPMWTFMSILNNSDENDEKNQNRVDFLANIVSDMKKKNDDKLTESMKIVIQKIGDIQKRLNNIEKDFSETKVMIENTNTNNKNIFTSAFTRISSNRKILEMILNNEIPNTQQK